MRDLSFLQSKIQLSKTILSPSVLTISFSSFVSKLVYSLWHSIPFETIAQRQSADIQIFNKFVHELLLNSSLNFSVVLLGLKYIYDLRMTKPKLTGAKGSECRLIVCSLMIAMKCLCDNTYSNRSWSKLSGIPLDEINQTEREFLSQINFNLYVKPADYFAWVEHIESSVTTYRKFKNAPISPISPQHDSSSSFPLLQKFKRSFVNHV